MKINQKLCQILLVALVGSIIIWNQFSYGATEDFSDPRLLYQTLVESGVEVKTFFFEHNDKMKDSYTKEELIDIKKKLEKVWEISFSDVSAGEETIRLQGKRESGLDTLKVAFISTPLSQDQYTGHLIIQLVTKDKEKWEEKYTGFMIKLRASDVETIVNTSMQGDYAEVLGLEQRKSYIYHMFNQLNGEIVEGVSSESVVSWTGYTEQIGRSLTSRAGNINVQIGAHVHSSKKSTSITIGSPVITMEY